MPLIRELLGCEVRYGKQVLFVALADRDKGITLKDMETEEDVICLNKEEVLAWIHRSDRNRQYHEAFNHIVMCIKKGSFNGRAVFYHNRQWEVKSCGFVSFSSTEVTCPF